MEGYSWTLPPAPSAPLAMGQALRKVKESAGGVHVGTEAGYVTVTRGLGSSLYSGRAGVQSPGGSLLFTVNLSGWQRMSQGGLFLSRNMA